MRQVTLLKITVGVVLFLIIALGVYVLASPLPPADVPLSSRVFDVNGKLIASLYSQENRVEAALTDMAAHFRDAVVAIEDSRFYEHFGVDPIAIARATYRNLKAGRVVEGGSTITQQLAKNLYLTPERTFERKLRELLLTLKLEARYSKEQILRMYLNAIYFGHGAYGAEVASQTYFGKSVRDLTLAESALLAGVLRVPGRYSPYIDPSAALERREVVLNRMAELGYITPEEAEAANREPLRLVGLKERAGRAPYFVDYVVQQLEERYEADVLRKGGLNIYTTLDLNMQSAAEEAFLQGLPVSFRDARGVTQPQGALVALDPTNGAIRAFIGGRDFSETQLNRALAPRQPGSAFKPFVYLAAIENGYTAVSTLVCEPIALPVTGQPPWTPTDYGNEDYHWRPLTLREALRISDNVVSARLNYELGPAKGIATAHNLGIRSKLAPHLSSVLGTNEITLLEMAAAFAPFANGGKRVEPLAILRVENRFGQVLEEHRPNVQKAADERATYIISSILQDVTKPGGTASVVGRTVERPVAGKTGTSLGNAWFVGYTPDLVAAVYVGNDEPARDIFGTGGGLAAPIFANFMKTALQDKPVREFTRPAGIAEVEICSESGLLATQWCPQESVYNEVFIQGTQPWQPCNIHTPWSNWQIPWPFSLPEPEQPSTETPIETPITESDHLEPAPE
ncbi:MAG: PBP1A family penicillin-binding protein [Firmicutes bacterium]|nr:PBP1A family penicillin-binding protein [Bacillota bacterium]